MLQNQPAYVDRIIHDVANQEKIDRIRILSRDGKIIHSTYARERAVGRPQRRSLFALPSKRSATPTGAQGPADLDVQGPNGQSLLGSMESSATSRPATTPRAISTPRRRPSSACSTSFIRSTSSTGSCAPAPLGIAGVSLGLHRDRVAVGRLLRAPSGLCAAARPRKRGTTPVGRQPRPADPGAWQRRIRQACSSFNVMTELAQFRARSCATGPIRSSKKWKNGRRSCTALRPRPWRGEKLASVGLLASGVAHELNNPLTGNSHVLASVRQKMPDKSPDAEDMDLVIRETKRCAAIIKRCSIRPGKNPEKKFNDSIRSSRILYASSSGRASARYRDQPEPRPHAAADLDRCRSDHEVVMNMVVNASMPSRRRAASPYRSPRHANRRGRAEHRAGADGGDRDRRHRLRHSGKEFTADFRSVFTSKDVGKGTGLDYRSVTVSWRPMAA